jgi:hypothetical protein
VGIIQDLGLDVKGNFCSVNKVGQAPPYGKENNDGRTVEIATAFGPAMRGLDRFPGVVRNDAKAAWSV